MEHSFKKKKKKKKNINKSGKEEYSSDKYPNSSSMSILSSHGYCEKAALDSSPSSHDGGKSHNGSDACRNVGDRERVEEEDRRRSVLVASARNYMDEKFQKFEPRIRYISPAEESNAVANGTFKNDVGENVNLIRDTAVISMIMAMDPNHEKNEVFIRRTSNRRTLTKEIKQHMYASRPEAPRALPRSYAVESVKIDSAAEKSEVVSSPANLRNEEVPHQMSADFENAEENAGISIPCHHDDGTGSESDDASGSREEEGGRGERKNGEDEEERRPEGGKELHAKEEEEEGANGIGSDENEDTFRSITSGSSSSSDALNCTERANANIKNHTGSLASHGANKREQQQQYHHNHRDSLIRRYLDGIECNGNGVSDHEEEKHDKDGRSVSILHSDHGGRNASSSSCERIEYIGNESLAESKDAAQTSMESQQRNSSLSGNVPILVHRGGPKKTPSNEMPRLALSQMPPLENSSVRGDGTRKTNSRDDTREKQDGMAATRSSLEGNSEGEVAPSVLSPRERYEQAIARSATNGIQESPRRRMVSAPKSERSPRSPFITVSTNAAASPRIQILSPGRAPPPVPTSLSESTSPRHVAAIVAQSPRLIAMKKIGAPIASNHSTLSARSLGAATWNDHVDVAAAEPQDRASTATIEDRVLQSPYPNLNVSNVITDNVDALHNTQSVPPKESPEATETDSLEGYYAAIDRIAERALNTFPTDGALPLPPSTPNEVLHRLDLPTEPTSCGVNSNYIWRSRSPRAKDYVEGNVFGSTENPNTQDLSGIASETVANSNQDGLLTPPTPYSPRVMNKNNFIAKKAFTSVPPSSTENVPVAVSPRRVTAHNMERTSSPRGLGARDKTPGLPITSPRSLLQKSLLDSPRLVPSPRRNVPVQGGASPRIAKETANQLTHVTSPSAIAADSPRSRNVSGSSWVKASPRARLDLNQEKTVVTQQTQIAVSNYHAMQTQESSSSPRIAPAQVEKIEVVKGKLSEAKPSQISANRIEPDYGMWPTPVTQGGAWNFSHTPRIIAQENTSGFGNGGNACNTVCRNESNHVPYEQEEEEEDINPYSIYLEPDNAEYDTYGKKYFSQHA